MAFKAETIEDVETLMEALETEGALPPERRAEAQAAVKDFLARQQSRDTAIAPVEMVTPGQKAQAAQARQISSLIATNPVGKPQQRPRQAALGGGPLGFTPGATNFDPARGQVGAPREPASDDPFTLAAQAQAGGVDVNSGADLVQRIGVGLSGYKEPALKALLLERGARENIREAGIEYPGNAPVVFLDNDTGRLAVLRPIREGDVDKLGDSPENVGKLRVTLVDPVGIDAGDWAEFGPTGTVAGLQTGAGILAGAATGSPTVALGVSSMLSGGIELMAAPLRDRLLRNYFKLSKEEIAQFSDPNEALVNAAWAAGGELGIGGLMQGINAVRRGRRFIPPEEYDTIVAEMGRVRDVADEFRAVTGVDMQPSDELVAAASGAGAGTQAGQRLARRARSNVGRLVESEQERVAAENLNTRMRVGAGFIDLTNRAVNTLDPANLVALGNQRGLAAPNIGDEATRALQTRRLLEEDAGVPGAQRGLERSIAREEAALDQINDQFSSARVVRTQEITAEGLLKAENRATAAWANFDSYMRQHGLVIRNSGGLEPGAQIASPIQQTLNRIGRDGVENLSAKLGQKQTAFVEDLASLREPTLDAQRLYRLHRQLSLEGTPEARELVAAIDSQLSTGDWINPATGRLNPAKAEQAHKRYAAAANATEFFERMSQKDVIRALTDLQPGSTEFSNFPSSARRAVFNPQNPEALRDVLAVTGNNPRVRQALAKEMEALYRRTVYPGRRFSAADHDRFMRDFGDHMDQLFTPEDAARIRNVETMTDAVARSQARLKKVEDTLSKEFGSIWSRGDRIAPDHFINEAMANKGVSLQQMRNTMRVLDREDPALAQQMRAEMAQWMGDRMLATSSLRSVGALRKLRNENGGKIGAIMGAQYVKDLEVVEKALSLTDLAEGATARVMNEAWVSTARAIFGPLDPKNRVLTRMNEIMRRRGAASALRIMSDPDALGRFVELRRLDPQLLAVQSTLRQNAIELGLAEYFREAGIDLETLPPEAAVGELDQFRRMSGAL
ncbi:MAG: hypothetical protein QNJ97_17885 [Myxococcota bacterium]|nr:hypothetical protein [Myxococcota bacterium]